MNYLVFDTPNGLKANKNLNNLSAKLQKRYSKSVNIKIGFEIGFDGIWELVIKNIKTDKAIVLKESNRAKAATEVFGYFESFENQPLHNELACVANTRLEEACISLISLMSK